MPWPKSRYVLVKLKICKDVRLNIFQIWTALELEGLGANLQHMNAIPPVEDAIKKEWNIPADWSLKAHLNFGGYAQEHPARPDKIAVDETVAVYKS